VHLECCIRRDSTAGVKLILMLMLMIMIILMLMLALTRTLTLILILILGLPFSIVPSTSHYLSCSTSS